MPRPSSGRGLSIAELSSLIESRRTELNRLRKQRTDLQRKLDAVDRDINKIAGGGVGRRGGGNGRVRNPMSLTATIEHVLSKSGKPMRVGDIAQAVQASGYRSNAANFRGIVNQTLIKDKRFGAADRGVYQLKK